MGHHENEPTYLAIGRFVFEFSQLEYTLKHHIAEAADLNERFIDPIMTHDFALLCTAAKQILGEAMDDERKEQLNKIIGECYSLNQERVRVAHGLWVPFREGGVVNHVARSNLKSNRSIGQAEHLESQADRARDLRASLERLL